MTVQLTINSQILHIQSQLNKALGSPTYAQYIRLMESFLAGRLFKEEFEGILRSILCSINFASASIFDLHNKHVALLLEKLAAVESEVMEKWQREEYGAMHVESRQLNLNSIEFTVADEFFFVEASKRSPVPQSLSPPPIRSLIGIISQCYLQTVMKAMQSSARPSDTRWHWRKRHWHILF